MVVIGAENLGEEIRRLAAPVFIENVDADFGAGTEDPSPAVADGQAVFAEEIAEEGFEGEAAGGDHAVEEEFDAAIEGDAGDFAGIGVGEGIGFAAADGEGGPGEVDGGLGFGEGEDSGFGKRAAEETGEGEFVFEGSGLVMNGSMGQAEVGAGEGGISEVPVEVEVEGFDDGVAEGGGFRGIGELVEAGEEPGEVGDFGV